MALPQESIKALESSIVEGTFPDSDEFLRADLTIQSIPVLLASISKAKDDLGIEIQAISKEQAEDVDDWIFQAKKIQEDIARCKLEARQIVEEYERVETTKGTVTDAKNKVHLLESEITFNQALQHELESLEEIRQVLDEAYRDLAAWRPAECAERLVSIHASIKMIPRGLARDLLVKIDGDIRQKTCSQLRDVLDEIWITKRDARQGKIEVRATQSPQNNALHKIPVSRCLEAFAILGLTSEASELILSKLEQFFLPPLSRGTRIYFAAVQRVQSSLVLTFTDSPSDTLTLLQILQETINFLHATLPEVVKDNVARDLMPKLISSLIRNWLDVALPYELSDMKSLPSLRSRVTELESTIASFAWPGHQDLSDWLEQIPRNWLNKRRATSLDAVRMAFRSATANTRQVERIERQLVKKEDFPTETNAEEDDWNANWDEDPAEEKPPATKGNEDDDEVSGWDFENENDDPGTDTKTKSIQDEEDDAGEAWGWGDESPTEARATEVESKPVASDAHKDGSEEEVVLKEIYTITDIPDHVLEVIGKDISDSETLKASQDETIFTSSAPVSALQALPTLVLAMFRATAPTHYNHTRKLSNMNLYNDIAYIVQKVTETADPQTQAVLQPALDTMLKFGRQTYTRELDIQRTILSDLLDGAQGFVSCNSDQYRELSANAVSAVVDRIRQLQREYKGILGQSHLLQTIGSLTSMVIGKIISDIEDLEDISEKESNRLVEYCQQIISLEDLFIATKPHGSITDQVALDTADEVQRVSTIALYVPNYFRFQYLAEILKSSLADIKFMWIDGGLKSDFDADEVIDLIKALFAESNHRRNAISAVRTST